MLLSLSASDTQPAAMRDMRHAYSHGDLYNTPGMIPDMLLQSLASDYAR